MELTKEEWYEHLIDECKSIITETIFTSRWALVEGYHQLGQRIREDKNWEKYSKGSYSSLQDLARNIGISGRTVYYSIQFYEKYPILDEVPEGKNITWNKVCTKYLPEQKNNPITLPKGKYGVIYADPPWEYQAVQHIESKITSAATDHYPTMSVEQICKLKIQDLTNDDCVLFIWVTSPLLEKCFPVINAWGFSYRASFVWDKVKHNVGHYNSVRHEFLLIATKGKGTPDNVKLFDSVQSIEKTTKHSEKPEEFRKIINTLYPTRKKIELFARVKTEGWDAWGNQV